MQRGIGLPGIAGFVLAALLIGWISGRFGQRLFDDEVLTLAVIENRSYGDLIRFFMAGGDVHPPLPFLWFRLLQDLQAPLWLQRVLSLAIAATGFALVLDLVRRRLPSEAAVRILAVVLFLGAPLLYGMGASLRWYPLLVLPVALALWSALTAGRPTVLAALSFGVAANLSFLAAIPALAYLVCRHAIARRFDLPADLKFILVMLLVASPAFMAFFGSTANLGLQIGVNPLLALGMTALGIVGGYGLGLTHSLIAIPFVLLSLVALAGAIFALRRGQGGDLLAVALLTVLLCLVLTGAGFAKPRSFLFAVPFVMAIVVLGVAGFSWLQPLAWIGVVASVTLAVPVLWLLSNSDRPYKRNLHIPDREILAVISERAPKESSLIVSSEPALGWQLRRQGYCVIAASLEEECAKRGLATVVMIDDGTFASRPGFSRALSGLTLDYKPVHQQLFGDDEDGPTKTFLSGVLVPKWLVSVAIYRKD